MATALSAALPMSHAEAARLPGCAANGTVSAAGRAHLCNKCKESAKRKLKDLDLRKLVSDCACERKKNDWERLPNPAIDPDDPDPLDQEIDKMNCFWPEDNPGNDAMNGHHGSLHFFADKICSDMNDPRDVAFADLNSGNLCTHEVLHNLLEARGIPAEDAGDEPQHNCIGGNNRPGLLDMWVLGANRTGGAWFKLCLQTHGCNNYCQAKECYTFKDPTGRGRCPLGIPLAAGRTGASYDFCHWACSTMDPESKAICHQAIVKFNTGVRGCK